MTVKRTFSLPDDVSQELDEAAGGNASAYVTEALRARLAQEAAAAELRSLYGEPDPVALGYWTERLTGEGPPRPAARPRSGAQRPS